VYFPGYGWAEFEPTADEAPLDRPDDVLPTALLPTLAPLPSPTPWPTATPTMPPLPTQPGGANATPTSPADAPFAASTPTPTQPPTATPPPPPDVTRVGGDKDSNILRTALLTLGVFALVVLLLIVTILFVIWYVEYRGLAGLNIIERAYARMAIYGRWLGLRFAESATPDERRRYLVGEVPEGEQPINSITRAFVENRYATPNPETDLANMRTAREAWQDARWAFVRRKFARLLGRDPADT
jgi:hypothetical protein